MLGFWLLFYRICSSDGKNWCLDTIKSSFHNMEYCVYRFSFNRVLWFSSYRAYTYAVRFVPKPTSNLSLLNGVVVSVLNFIVAGLQKSNWICMLTLCPALCYFLFLLIVSCWFVRIRYINNHIIYKWRVSFSLSWSVYILFPFLVLLH